MQASAAFDYFAPCPRGLEAELARELTDLGAAAVQPGAGGVACTGDLELGWRVNLWSRLAVRVLLRVDGGRYRHEDDLYAAAHALAWPEWFDPRRTLAVSTVARACPLRSLNYVTLRIKDAVCDRFRAACGVRPSVHTRAPEVPLVLYLERDRYALYIDLTGEPLNRRGYRVRAAAAPLNENLAAGVLRLAGWQPGEPLLDPMMGGGTLLLEATLMALDIAPGLRRRFAFEHLACFDAPRWQALREQAQARARPPVHLPIFGADLDPAMVEAARANLRAAGLEKCVQLKQADVLTLDPPAAHGVLVSNPPYGVRLPRQAPEAFYRALGDALKRRFAGWSAWLLSADPLLPKTIGLRAQRRIPLYNGPLACRLYGYPIVVGPLRAPASGKMP
ncbi:MAG: THUMP domain-containing protein [Thiobacillaceae bacterium]|nr:THUMP domain-containing protein [Thiobacillaceae bacterium]MCX7674189.1 THUMP domain-containing protein [Thiobacillaceae bacterium]MDW8322873.1 THUMP domain-containing protein [Burkholderiales bacterium]